MEKEREPFPFARWEIRRASGTRWSVKSGRRAAFSREGVPSDSVGTIQKFDKGKSRLKALGNAPFKSLTSTRC